MHNAARRPMLLNGFVAPEFLDPLKPGPYWTERRSASLDAVDVRFLDRAPGVACPLVGVSQCIAALEDVLRFLRPFDIPTERPADFMVESFGRSLTEEQNRRLQPEAARRRSGLPVAELTGPQRAAAWRMCLHSYAGRDFLNLTHWIGCLKLLHSKDGAVARSDDWLFLKPDRRYRGPRTEYDLDGEAGQPGVRVILGGISQPPPPRPEPIGPLLPVSPLGEVVEPERGLVLSQDLRGTPISRIGSGGAPGELVWSTRCARSTDWRGPGSRTGEAHWDVPATVARATCSTTAGRSWPTIREPPPNSSRPRSTPCTLPASPASATWNETASRAGTGSRRPIGYS